jgi:tRNA pseudouridine(38-40) synthase
VRWPLTPRTEFYHVCALSHVYGSYKAGGIAECNYRDFHKISWTRAARTDKGVHATGNVVSFKMLAPCVELEDGSTVRCLSSLPTNHAHACKNYAWL